MDSIISEGVKVNVETFYQQDYSNPVQREFMHAYRITIENHNSFSIKLMSRKWTIFDIEHPDTYKEVEGEGVVGVQPIISAGEEYQYVSGCSLHNEIGSMRGVYTMKNIGTGTLFHVTIPHFYLVAPMKLN